MCLLCGEGCELVLIYLLGRAGSKLVVSAGYGVPGAQSPVMPNLMKVVILIHAMRAPY